MIESIKKVAVKYNGELVGNLLELDDCSIAFQYSKNLLERGFSVLLSYTMKN